MTGGQDLIEFITKIDFAVLEFIRNTLNSSFMDYIMPIITDIIGAYI